MARRRHTNTSPYHFCGRCGIRTDLNKMRWQTGILKCPSCIDVSVLGERDREVQRALLQIVANPIEGKPHENLTEPGLRVPIEEITI